MKKSFAVIEIVVAVVIAVATVSMYTQFRRIAMPETLNGLSEALGSYREVVNSSNEVYQNFYGTIPQHRRTMVEICREIDYLKGFCKGG